MDAETLVSHSLRLPVMPAGSGSPELPGKKLLGGDVTPEEVVVAYHERTKHHYHRFSASLGYMDWATQPDPFRRYEGALLVRLPLPDTWRALPYWQLYVLGSVAPMPLSIDSLSVFFRYALSLTRWKAFEGTTWSLRANPSSGNLHPTEGYAVLPALGGVHDRPAIYHYAPKEHGLERRADLDLTVWSALMAAFPPSSFLVGLSSIHWREAWKYGERAFRYCQHDAGHAIATVRYAAAALGWSALLLDSFSDDDVAAMLGLDRAPDFAGVDSHDREHPEALILVSRGPVSAPPQSLPMETIRASHWTGQANLLSPTHVDWNMIDDVAEATWKPATDWPGRVEQTPLPPLSSACRSSAAT